MSMLFGSPAADSERIAEILATCPTIDVETGVHYSRDAFPAGALLVVGDGFVVVRATPRGRARSSITCEAGPGGLVLPLSPDEVLFALGASRLTAITRDALDQFLAVPGAGRALLEQLAAMVAQRQEAISNFAFPRHIDRLRRKLLQLGRNYGRVAGDGIRIDFPVSHTVLAEMIGSSRETVTRGFDELERAGFVARRGHTYRLLVSPETMLGAAPA